MSFRINTNSLIFGCLFCRKKPPEGAPPASTRGLEASNHLGWSHPITLRSLVVWSTDIGPNISQTFYKFLTFCKVVWDHLGCVWGVVKVLRSNLCRKTVQVFHVLKKCLGGSRMVLGVPRILLTNLDFPGNLTFLENMF